MRIERRIRLSSIDFADSKWAEERICISKDVCVRCKGAILLPIQRGFALISVQSEYDIQFHLLAPTPMVAMLHVHPSVDAQLVTPDVLKVEHAAVGNDFENSTLLAVEDYLDGFGNRCSRFVAPAGAIRLSGGHVIRVDDQPEIQGFGAMQAPVEQLPHEVLPFLLAKPLLRGR